VVFELTVAFGDPVMAHRMIERVRDVYPFQGYALLAFAASCLIVGQTFFLLAWFTDWIIDFLYRAQRYLILHLTLGSDSLYRAVGKLRGMPPKMYFRHLWRPIMWARGKKVPFEIRPILRCQRMAATQLLKRKFAVTLSKGQLEWVDREWQAWLKCGQILGFTLFAVLNTPVRDLNAVTLQLNRGEVLRNIATESAISVQRDIRRIHPHPLALQQTTIRQQAPPPSRTRPDASPHRSAAVSAKSSNDPAWTP
jgi:hypothetical protein